MGWVEVEAEVEVDVEAEETIVAVVNNFSRPNKRRMGGLQATLSLVGYSYSHNVGNEDRR